MPWQPVAMQLRKFRVSPPTGASGRRQVLATAMPLSWCRSSLQLPVLFMQGDRGRSARNGTS